MSYCSPVHLSVIKGTFAIQGYLSVLRVPFRFKGAWCLFDQEAWQSTRGKECPLLPRCISHIAFSVSQVHKRIKRALIVFSHARNSARKSLTHDQRREIVDTLTALFCFLGQGGAAVSRDCSGTACTHRLVYPPPRPFPVPHTAEPFRQLQHQLRSDKRQRLEDGSIPAHGQIYDQFFRRLPQPDGKLGARAAGGIATGGFGGRLTFFKLQRER